MTLRVCRCLQRGPAEPSVRDTHALLWGMPSCPWASWSPAHTTAGDEESKSRAPDAGSASYPFGGTQAGPTTPSMVVSLWKIRERRQSMREVWEAQVS